LALIDGRSIYQDYLGFVLWDSLPIQPSEIRQIEVIRGPASAVWGANAMDGVVNIITKTPREMVGSTLTLGFGAIDRKAKGSDLDTGTVFYARGTHAAAVNDRWAYKLSTGFYNQDAFPRPSGVIPNPFQTPYPSFPNSGTTTPEVDVRVDYDSPKGGHKLVFAGGVSGVSGIIHSGSGPFDINNGSVVGYGRVSFAKGNFQLKAFLNITDGDAISLLSLDPQGQPIPLIFKNYTSDVEFTNTQTLGGRHLITYGGNLRYSNFDLSVAPLGRNRTEAGVYVQDEIALNDHFRWVIGGRLDKFGIVENPAFSPRTALIVKPRPDHALRFSFNRAFRAPTFINNFLDLELISAIDLGLIDPGLAGQVFPFTVEALGNEALEKVSMNSYEVGYTGIWGGWTRVGAAYYFNDTNNNILFSQVASYTSENPPANWPLPPFVLDLLVEAGAGLPRQLMDVNVGRVKGQGLELWVDTRVHPAVDLFANYSWQKEPTAEGLTLDEINIPPSHRVNAGVRFDRNRYFGSFSVNYTDDAFWRDVLDARFHGPTDSFTLLDASFGYRWAQGRIVSMVKTTNLANREIQQHVFGDVIKRQVIGELRFLF
jgi:iron complex outermembrane receptor protein